MKVDNPTGTGSSGTSPSMTVGQAAKAFEGLLGPAEDEQGNPEPQEAIEEEEQETAESEASEEDEQEPVEDLETEVEEETDEEAQEEEPLYTVKIDGKEEKVSLAELQDGYQRTSDYTRKTQQLAEQRKAAEAELESARAERAEYASLLPKLRMAFETGMGPEPNWEQLRKENPMQATLLWQQREDQKRHLAALEAEEARVADQTARENEQAAEQRALQERNRLLEKLSSWRDPKVATKEASEIKQLLADVGFAEEEQSITDHRHVLLLRKAVLYDQMMAKRKSLDGKKARAPVVKPGAAVPAKGNPQAQQAAKLKQTGSVKDAAKLFENFLS